jgi:exopolysaccharide biosynthesis polyprenyl glycosylphosphotransferase
MASSISRGSYSLIGDANPGTPPDFLETPKGESSRKDSKDFSSDNSDRLLARCSIGNGARKERLFSRIVEANSLAAISIASVGTWIFFKHNSPDVISFRTFIADYSLSIIGFTFFWILLARQFGLTSSYCYRSGRTMIIAVAKTATCVGGLLLAMALLIGPQAATTSFLARFIPCSLSLLAIQAFLTQRGLVILSSRRVGHSVRRVLVIDESADASRMLNIALFSHWRIELVKDTTLTALLHDMLQKPEVSYREWAGRISQCAVDEVVVASDWAFAQHFEPLGQACAERGITFRVLVKASPPEVGRYYVEDTGDGHHLLSLEATDPSVLRQLLKRLLDITVAIPGLIVCALVGFVYYFRLRRESPGQLIFRQQRVGLNGRRFTLYKFRTMYPDAEARLHELEQHNQMTGFMFKVENDPRIIPSGHSMRRRHLDELPQFWNVLKGEMSLVGTRPPTERELTLYEAHHHRRLSMKPGITGLWQIAGNAHVPDFEDVVRLDCKYIDSWSLVGDLRIVTLTILKVLRGAGW